MVIKVLKSKCAAIVTDDGPTYDGSIIIGSAIVSKMCLQEYERVEVWNEASGTMLFPYVVESDSDCGSVRLGGANRGDLIIILSFVEVGQLESKDYRPKILNASDMRVIQRMGTHRQTAQTRPDIRVVRSKIKDV